VDGDEGAVAVVDAEDPHVGASQESAVRRGAVNVASEPERRRAAG
jgi:hypothetical protein